MSNAEFREGQDFYAQGLETGKRWDDNYRPGGPFRTSPVPMDHMWYAMYLRDIEDSKTWFLGFDAGLEYQKVFKRLKSNG